MSELCLSRKTWFSSLLISDLKQFCSFLVSHPLYLSYFLFFSPYLLRILSFLFPLVFTTSLLLLAFLTVSPGKGLIIAHRKFSPDSKLGRLLSACHAQIEDGNQESFALEDFEAYKIVFEGPIMGVQENQAEFLEQSSVEEADKKLEDLFKELGESESMANVKDQAQGANAADKVVENQKARNGSEDAITANDSQKHGVNRPALKLECSTTLAMDYNLVSNGSMRKEKEWKRTLACKLYEERNSTDGSGEGMDLLWETYEMDAIKSKAKQDELKKKKKTKKRWESKRYIKDDSDDEEDEAEVSDQLCCLQALKFSAGKVNLGMGKPNLMKISKAIKGFGWLHHVSKHSKKVHIEDRL